MTRSIVTFYLLLCWSATTVFAQASGIPLLQNVHRVLFLGNSITYAGSYISDIETYFVINYPNQPIEFINVGLPSETVSGLSEQNHANGQFPRPDLHERLARVLDKTRPDLVFACYGMNDGIGMPLDSMRFRKFREGILWLHAQLLKTNATIIHVTPPIYDERKGNMPGYSAVLDFYSSWLLSLKDSLHWNVADVHFPMKAELEARLEADSAFYFSADGVHPDSVGHFVIAKQLLLYLGVSGDKLTNMSVICSARPQGSQIYALIARRQAIMKDAWLTNTGHKRPGMNTGLPLAEAKEKYKIIGIEIENMLKR